MAQTSQLMETLNSDVWRAAWSVDCCLEQCSGIASGCWSSVKITALATVISVRIGAFFDVYGTHWALILVNITFSLPLTVLLFRNYHVSIPHDLFDEPLSSLDAQLRAGLRGEIKRLHEALPRVMVSIIHD